MDEGLTERERERKAEPDPDRRVVSRDDESQMECEIFAKTEDF